MQETQDVQAIDAAIRAAKEQMNTSVKPTTPEERAQARKEKAERRVTEQAEKARLRMEKRAAREAAKAMRKNALDKARERLPVMDEHVSLIVDKARVLKSSDVDAIIKHLSHWQREQATNSATWNMKVLAVGQAVMVTNGRFAGTLGQITKSGRIRVHVAVKDGEKDRVLYLFASEVTPQ